MPRHDPIPEVKQVLPEDHLAPAITVGGIVQRRIIRPMVHRNEVRRGYKMDLMVVQMWVTEKGEKNVSSG